MSEKREYTLHLVQEGSGRTASVHITQGGKAVTPPPPEPPKPEVGLLIPVVVRDERTPDAYSPTQASLLVTYDEEGATGQSQSFSKEITGVNSSEERIGQINLPPSAQMIELVDTCSSDGPFRAYLEGAGVVRDRIGTNGLSFPTLASLRERYGNDLQVIIVAPGSSSVYE